MRKPICVAMISMACLGCSPLLPGDGPGTVAGPAHPRFATGSAPGSVEVADLNGDGKPDLIVANEQSQNVTVLLGDGRALRSPPASSPTTSLSVISTGMASWTWLSRIMRPST